MDCVGALVAGSVPVLTHSFKERIVPIRFPPEFFSRRQFDAVGHASTPKRAARRSLMSA